MNLSEEFFRGVIVGLIGVGLGAFLKWWLVDAGAWDLICDWIRFKLRLRLDFNAALDQVVELKKSNEELARDIVEEHNRIVELEGVARTDQGSIAELERKKTFQAHMIERLADHCKSLDPRTDKAQFLVSARTYAEIQMEKDNG